MVENIIFQIRKNMQEVFFSLFLLSYCTMKLFSKWNFFIHLSLKLGPKFPFATWAKHSFDGEGFNAFSIGPFYEMKMKNL